MKVYKELGWRVKAYLIVCYIVFHITLKKMLILSLVFYLFHHFNWNWYFWESRELWTFHNLEKFLVAIHNFPFVSSCCQFV